MDIPGINYYALNLDFEIHFLSPLLAQTIQSINIRLITYPYGK